MCWKERNEQVSKGESADCLAELGIVKKILMASILKAIFIWPQTKADLLGVWTCSASKSRTLVRTSNRF